MGKEIVVFAIVTAAVLLIAYLSLTTDAAATKEEPEKKADEKADPAAADPAKDPAEPSPPPPPPPPPKTYEEMTNEELSKELARLRTMNNGDDKAPAVANLKAYIERRDLEKQGFPTTADLEGATGNSQTGIEKASVQTLTFLEKAYREVFRYSQDTSVLRPKEKGVNMLKDRLLECVKKTLSDEEKRRDAAKDALTKNTSVRKDAATELDKYRAQWKPAYKNFEAYLEADRGRRAPNVMISFLIHMNLQGDLENYVENPYSFVRLNVAENTPKVLEWVLTEKYKMDNAGSKALRPIMDADSNAMRSNLKTAGRKAMEVEATRLRKSYDEHNVSDISGRSAKKLLYEDFRRQKSAAESAYDDAVKEEPRGVMFDLLWTTQEITKMSVDEIAKLVANPAAWVEASADNAKRMRTFIFTNEYFR